MNPITRDLAQAHITEMRRRACPFRLRRLLRLP
jgi:hypothetical protein